MILAVGGKLNTNTATNMDPSVSNSLVPDQAQHFPGPDLDPNCLQNLSEDNTSRQRVNVLFISNVIYYDHIGISGLYCFMNMLTAIIYNQFRGYFLVSRY